MNEYQSLSHTKWECKYHVVFIPKYRRKVLYGQLRNHLGEVFRELARQKESRIEEGHLQPDHVHILVSIPPKYAVAQVVGYLKGKSAIHIPMPSLPEKAAHARSMAFLSPLVNSTSITTPGSTILHRIVQAVSYTKG